MDLYRIIYLSTATTLYTEYELAELLSISRDHNQSNGVTGILLYAEGTFLQVLEGERLALGETYRRILIDTRHKNIIEIASTTITERLFANWAMGFASVNADVLKAITGYRDPSQAQFLTGDDSNAVIYMLKNFVADNRMN